MWTKYKVSVEFTEPFAAAIPRTEAEIRAMLENRMPGRKPENAVPIDDLASQVAAEVGIEEDDEDGFLPGWATFKRNPLGLYYEGRCVRGHLKDCAGVLAGGFVDLKAFRSKFVNRVYVIESQLPLMWGGVQITEPDGNQQRFIQVMTRQGPRSSIKYIDYVDAGTALAYTIGLLDDGVIKRSHLDAVLEYGAVHGMGQERSQGWGRYSYQIEAV